MTYIKPIALAAALLAALTISFPAEAKSDTLSSAEEAVEEGKISDKDLALLFQQLKEAYRKSGNDSSFDWKGMSSVILGEILKSDDVQKNKKCIKFPVFMQRMEGQPLPDKLLHDNIRSMTCGRLAKEMLMYVK